MTKKERAKLKRQEDKARKRKAAETAKDAQVDAAEEDNKGAKEQKRQKVVLFKGK